MIVDFCSLNANNIDCLLDKIGLKKGFGGGILKFPELMEELIVELIDELIESNIDNFSSNVVILVSLEEMSESLSINFIKLPRHLSSGDMLCDIF
jgi:hypothetical protein